MSKRISVGSNESRNQRSDGVLSWDDVKYALSGYINAHYDHLNVEITREFLALSLVVVLLGVYIWYVGYGAEVAFRSVIYMGIFVTVYLFAGIHVVSMMKRTNAIHHLDHHIEPETGDSFVEKLKERHDVTCMFDVQRLVDKEGYNLVRRILSSKHTEDTFLYDDAFQTHKFCNNCSDPH
jgi:hypothetical protein